SVHVVGRERPLKPGENGDRLVMSSGDSVDFTLLPEIHNPFSLLFGNHITEPLHEVMHKCDYLVARLPSIFGIKAVRLALKYKIPFAVEVVGCPWDSLWNYGTLRARIFAPWMWWQTRCVVRDAPICLYVTRQFL